EYYEPPKQPDGSFAAFNMRGVDLDSKGIAWVAFGSGELGRFDRSKCTVTNGPTANGQQCPDGWSFFDTPGPKVSGVKIGRAIWSDNSETALWHQETGEGSYGKVIKFQLRPDPLAD